ncbi:ABC transporter ATP-binding protein [Lacticaseibacillus daqingensis]|uniref:ABC transporter ATP-binding protein n=1 Tax=Lacticaseibacillus daqingensis TaxID=2486014 RepID=UPI001CDCB054|nr:ABC transporter ATP-binding protein [Lacticaseibacillus daqingensis]
MTAIIEAHRISKTIAPGGQAAPLPILRGIEFTAAPGEFVSILGPSGSGKTTLLRCLSGLTALTAGTILINGQPLSALSAKQLALLRRTTLSYIFQSYNLLPALSVLENIVLPLRLSHHPINVQAVQRLMAELRFKADLHQRPAALSGGEQQKVAIARALMTKAKLIFADEPTGALDSLSRAIIFDKLRALAVSGACVVMVTHDIAQAAKTDRTLILRDGRIAAIDTRPTERRLFEAMQSAEQVRP